MRRDIKYVIVERPRKSHGSKTLRTHRDLEDAPSKVSMKGTYEDHKELSDFLSPIKRFLQKSCGRSWNNVYSEIRQNLNGNSTMQAHVLQHVKSYVAQNPQFIDGKPFDIYGYEITTYKRWTRFYVDEKGILRMARKSP